MDEQPVQKRRSIPAILGAHVRGKMVAGVLALIPLVVTFLILRLVFYAVDDTVQPLVEQIFGREIVGVGIGITAVAIYVVGLLATNFAGRATIRWGEAVILRVPVARWIYTVSKGIVDALSAVSKNPSRVVLVQWPKAGTYTLGFLTSTVVDHEGRSYHNVLIPTTPTPQTGFLAIMPEEEVTFTDLTMEEGIRIVVSSGVLSPKDLMRQIKKAPRQAEPVAGTEPGAGGGGRR